MISGPALRKAAVWGATRAPRWVVRLGPVIVGFLLSFVLRRERGQVRKNWRLVRGPRSWLGESADIARTFIEFARSMTAAMARDRFTPPRFEVRGQEWLEARLRAREGFVLGTCHVGSWDLVIQSAFAPSGKSVLIVMGHEGDGSGQAAQDEVRKEQVAVLRIGTHPLDSLPALRHLSEGGIVGMQLDRTIGQGHEVLLCLFGQPYKMAAGPLRLAAIAQVPLVPVFTARLGEGRYLVQIEKPLFFSPRPSEAELAAALAPVCQALEAHIRAFPTQWFAFR